MLNQIANNLVCTAVVLGVVYAVLLKQGNITIPKQELLILGVVIFFTMTVMKMVLPEMNIITSNIPLSPSEDVNKNNVRCLMRYNAQDCAAKMKFY